MVSWLLCASLFLMSIQEKNCLDAPGVLLFGPQNVTVDKDLLDQISITWEDDPSSYRLQDKLIYYVEVLLTDNMKEVHHDTVDVRPEQTGTKHHWNWTSPLPLECTSHSVRLRSQYQNHTSEWSHLQTITGFVPSKYPKVVPRSRVVKVGSNFTFCCILGPEQSLKYMKYDKTKYDKTSLDHISNHTYALNVYLKSPSPPTCTNVICNSIAFGTCVFAGYPPDDRKLECETRDLESVECHWDIGRATNLSAERQTFYHLNGRACPKETTRHCSQPVQVDQGERIWTLVAKNPLGRLELRDTADLNKRVHMLAPIEVMTSDVNARNASVQWSWEKPRYSTLPMVCQVKLNSSGYIDMRNYSGIGLRSVVLHGLAPAQTYTVQVQCGSTLHFWKWGSWSKRSTFQTQEDIPEALDVWMQINGDQTIVVWKPLSVNQSHGQIKDYIVTWGRSSDKKGEKIIHPPHHSVPLSLGNTSEEHVVKVTARNSNYSSSPSVITGPRFLPDRAIRSIEVTGSNGGFDLSWSASPNATCGYVVDWCPTYSECSVDWMKQPAGITQARIQSASFKEGVRYMLSIYACTHGPPQLLERREGYMRECFPNGKIPVVKATQVSSSDVQISWTGIPPKNQRAFIRGYIIYYIDDSRPSNTSLFNVRTDNPEARTLTVRNLNISSYTFTVKALTSVGEGGENSVTYQMNLLNDQLIMVVLVSLGVTACLLTAVTVLCYMNRKRVKEKCYPDIPEPRWRDDWLTPVVENAHQMPVHEDFCPHSNIYIVGGDSEASDEDVENDGGQKEGTLLNTDSDILSHRYINQPQNMSPPAPYTSLPPAPYTSLPPQPTSFSTPFVTVTEIKNPSYNPVEQSVGYQPHVRYLYHPYPEPNNATSDLERVFRGYSPQSRKGSTSPGAESFSPTSSTHFLLSDS